MSLVGAIAGSSIGFLIGSAIMTGDDSVGEVVVGGVTMSFVVGV
jgi:hypothetical protein